MRAFRRILSRLFGRPYGYVLDGSEMEAVVGISYGVASRSDEVGNAVAVIYQTSRGRQVHLLMSQEEVGRHKARLAHASREAFGPSWAVPCEN